MNGAFDGTPSGDGNVYPPKATDSGPYEMLAPSVQAERTAKDQFDPMLGNSFTAPQMAQNRRVVVRVLQKQGNAVLQSLR